MLRSCYEVLRESAEVLHYRLEVRQAAECELQADLVLKYLADLADDEARDYLPAMTIHSPALKEPTGG